MLPESFEALAGDLALSRMLSSKSSAMFVPHKFEGSRISLPLELLDAMANWRNSEKSFDYFCRRCWSSLKLRRLRDDTRMVSVPNSKARRIDAATAELEKLAGKASSETFSQNPRLCRNNRYSVFEPALPAQDTLLLSGRRECFF